jgi:hypothetical protein
MHGRAARIVGLLVALAGLFVGLDPGVGQASSSPPGFYFTAPWRGTQVVQLNRPAWFQGVAATGADNAWAVGDVTAPHTATTTGGFAVRWNGKHWLRMQLPLSGFVPVSVSARGSSGVWIFGYRPDTTNALASAAYALIYRNGKWRTLALPSGPTISFAFLWDLQSAVVSSHDVWVIGTSYDTDETHVRSVLYNWNGSKWSADPLASGDAYSLAAVPGAAWVTTIASGAVTTAWRWNGAVWLRHKLPYVTDGSVAAYSAAKAWITGSGGQDSTTTYLLTWNGRHWSRVQTPVAGNWGAATSDGHGGVWFGQWALRRGATWYEPSSLASWRGCDGAWADAVVTSVPGTNAMWLVGGCLTGPSGFSRPVIGMTGRL